MNDMRWAVQHYGYPQVLSCERCGRILYDDDEYFKSGYGGFLCPDCRDEDVFNDIYEEDENEDTIF